MKPHSIQSFFVYLVIGAVATSLLFMILVMYIGRRVEVAHSQVPPYGVTVDANGFLTGYAWANPRDDLAQDFIGPGATVLGVDNFGWVRFDLPSSELDTCPLPGQCKPAWLNRTDGIVHGWARFCAVYASGCEGLLKDNAYRGNWDGWLRLSGGGLPGLTHIVSIIGCDWSGWAWGGGDLAVNGLYTTGVGWVSFSSLNPNQDVGASYGTTGGCPGATAGPTLQIFPPKAILALLGFRTQQFQAVYDPDGDAGPLPSSTVTTSTDILWSTVDPVIATVVPTGIRAGFVEAQTRGSTRVRAIYQTGIGLPPLVASSSAEVVVEPFRVVEIAPPE